MTKLDLKREYSHLYRCPSTRVVEVDVPAFTYLMVDGAGDPNRCPAYGEAVEALFSVSYTLKFAVKGRASGRDYAVMPLEGLWWADDWSAFTEGRRDAWKWTMMIVQPDFIDREEIVAAIDRVRMSKDLAAINRLRITRWTEGRCAQVLHRGPFTEEGPTIETLHRFIDAHGERDGKHHEIYLSDVRRAQPARWKTILRQPMRTRGGTSRA